MVRRKSANEILWVARSVNAPEPPKPVEIPERGWLASSIELKRGVRVSEMPMDTLPAELIDEFFKVAH